MKQNLLLLLATVLLTLACLGTPQPTALPVNNSAATPEFVPSATPHATALPEPLGKLKITYILDGNVWFWSEATSAHQLTSDGDAISVKISSDGTMIAYSRSPIIVGMSLPANDLGDSLWIVNTDGSSPREIVNVKEYATSLLLANRIDYLFSNFYTFAFLPNSSWIYFSTSQYTGDYYLPSNDLYFANSNFGEKNPLLYKGKGGQFTFSPNGNYLAISSSSNIKVMQRDGSGLVTALHYPTISLETGLVQVVWMQNETGFYTVLPDNTGITSKYLFVSADGNISAQLAEFESDLSIPIISPDGLKVAYVKHTANMDELHIIEASTADTVIASYEGAPLLVPWGWSPDSTRVVFSNAHPMLLLTAGIGIPPSPLTEAISPHSLRWISADRFIFFREGNLLIGQINNPETISIASGFSNQADTKDYDFVVGP